ncbi:hypothetical protein [Ectobacillus ponti]|uniref:Uncharacterized protein n=1 Tax=Ectobacillus ponti TaxID=2961894 RepID=A0AA41XBA6_9BACI|nr:hypothetical protein [Ectobacillus ponti]MCP8970325.1 hypothetical protein [Ectobacillus ponti]
MKHTIHRCNCRKVWTVQNRKRRVTASSILLDGSWSVEVKPQRRCNPKGFVVAKQQSVILHPPPELIAEFIVSGQLLYNKEQVAFNVQTGEGLYFAADGACYLLRRGDE